MERPGPDARLRMTAAGAGAPARRDYAPVAAVGQCGLRLAHRRCLLAARARGRSTPRSSRHTRGCARAARRGGRAFPRTWGHVAWITDHARTCYFNLDIDVEHDRKEGMVEGRTRVDLIDPRSV